MAGARVQVKAMTGRQALPIATNFDSLELHNRKERRVAFGVCVTFEIKPGHREAFMPLMLANARASLADEAGCLQFDVLTDPARPGEVFLYELYTNRAAFDTHLGTPHFLRFRDAVARMISGKTERTYSEVSQ